MHLRFFHELEAVLDGAQEAVRERQGSCVASVDIAGARQLAQRGQRRRLADQRIGRSVHELQQLDGEFDVADATSTSFDLPVGEALSRDELFGAALHRAQLGKVVGVQPPFPDGIRSGGGKGGAELDVAGGRPRLQERLELPRPRPPFPVAREGVEGANEGAVSSLRSQIGVDPEGSAGDRDHTPGRA